jgi:hypothetical protein
LKGLVGASNRFVEEIQGFVEKRAGSSRPAGILSGHWSQLPLPMKRHLLVLFWLFLPALAGAQELSGLIEELDSRIQFGIFTDLKTEFSEVSHDAEWYSGQLVAHFTTVLSERSLYFAEISVSPDRGYNQVRMERAFFQFYFSDQFRLRLGRIHTPVSHWNATYHHGQYLQTTINRPEMVKDNNRFSPTCLSRRSNDWEGKAPR